MNINEKKEKRDNFIKIYDLVSLNRNISLIQINLLLRTIRNVYEFFLIGQFLLAQFSPQRSFSAKLSLLTKKLLPVRILIFEFILHQMKNIPRTFLIKLKLKF